MTDKIDLHAKPVQGITGDGMPIKEEDGHQKEWYATARAMTEEKLPEFVRRLAHDYQHDYGTICHAAAAAAIAAAWTLDKSPSGGITGFQAGAIMWEFIQHWMESEFLGQPMRLLRFRDMLYPQNRGKFMTILPETWADLQLDAHKLLAEKPDAHPAVIEHWQSIAAGKIPFGYELGA